MDILDRLFHRKTTVVPADEDLTWVGEDESRRVMIEIDPDVEYPRALDEIQELLRSNQLTEWSALDTYLLRARTIPSYCWDLARLPHDEVAPDNLRERGYALELARLWVTEQKHREIGYKPMYLKILKRPRWRI